MDYDKAENIFYEIRDSLGLEGYNFKWSWARGRLGTINHNEGVVKLSEAYVADNDEEAVRQTILHELAHAIDFKARGYSNHDRVFIAVCSKIGCHESRAKNVNNNIYIEPRYVFLCLCCKKIVGGMNKLPGEFKRSMKCRAYCRNNLFDTPLLRLAIIVKTDDDCQLSATKFEEYKNTVLKSRN